ncbi:ACSL6, partial [Symbiodinium microadriaticum]
MNSSAYQDSEHFPNGSVKDMSNATQTKMYDTLFRIYQDMIGDIPLFMANYSINTTAGAYLSQFASLHSSIMVNLMGSLKYRDQGDRFNYQTITACYAMNVYARATESYKARMAAFSAQSTSTVKCCSLQGQCTQCTGEAYGDSWQQFGAMALLFKSFGVAALGWLIGGAVAEEGSLRGIASNEKRAVELEGANMEQSLTAQNGQETDPEGPQSDLNETSQLQNLSQNLSQLQCSPKGSNTEDITAPLESLLCYRQHKSYVGAQTVAYWLTWLAPIPSWLQSVVMMQQVN